MTYRTQLIDHLSAYREQVLGVATPGVFNHRGKAIQKGHILPLEHIRLNLLASVRDQIEGYLAQQNRIHLHKYFHHLNSSQAFALNLFVPYFEGGQDASSCLLRALGVDGELSSWIPEDIPVESEETNLDVSWTLTNGRSYLCEVKLSEADFGTAKEDERHLTKLRDIYAPLLRGHVDETLLKPEAFCRHYQILRNAWHVLRAPDQTLLFLLPRANQTLWEALPKVTARFSESLSSRVHMVAVEDVLEALYRDADASAHLHAHAEALCIKYLPGWRVR